MTAPDWLTNRAGTLSTGVRADIVFVLLDGKPQYRLDVRPVGGSFGCDVIHTMNGKRIDTATKYADSAAALAGGLDQLRTNLGW